MEQLSTSLNGSAPDLVTRRAIAQFLALAKVANVEFRFIDGRLVLQARKARWKTWAAIRGCLDEIGIPAIEAYFRTTTSDERARLAAPAMH